MENCGNNNFLALHQEENAVREPAYWNSPQFPIDLSVNERIFLNLVEGLLNTQEKVMAKALSLLFVEIEMRADIKLCVFSECERVIHYFDNIRALTAAQESPRS